MRLVQPLSALSLILVLAACSLGSGRDSTVAPVIRPLYERIGGQPVVAATVDEFMIIAAADPRIARRLQSLDASRFKASLIDQLCVSLGGPCQYKGRPMKDTHAGMSISDAEFNAMTQDMRRALGRRDVTVELQTEFAAALEPLRNDIVSPMVPTRSVVMTQMIRPTSAKKEAVKKEAVKKPVAKQKPVPKNKPAATPVRTAA